MTTVFHLVGVGGVGMSALAECLLHGGRRVSGSDRLLDQDGTSPTLDVLRRAGVTLFPQDGSGVKAGSRVVLSSAIEEDNPDLLAARRLRCRRSHRAEVLAEWAAAGEGLAVAGTSGKTTVTGMIGWILEQAGYDPAVISGGGVTAWQSVTSTGRFRPGAGVRIIEVDESDRSLLRFRPRHAVLTTVSRDHFPLSETEALFRRFLGGVTDSIVIGPGTEPARPEDRKCIAVDRPQVLQRSPRHTVLAFRGAEVHLPMPGEHNALDAVLAIEACRLLGVELNVAADALGCFPGIERRLELVGAAGRIAVYDDMAHNPAKIRASWQALHCGTGRVLAAWRPHGFGPLAAMADDLIEVFAECLRNEDRLWLLPVYYAGGTPGGDMTSEVFAERARQSGLAIEVVEPANLPMVWAAEARHGDACLLMGARDPGLPLLARNALKAIADRSPGRP